MMRRASAPKRAKPKGQPKLLQRDNGYYYIYWNRNEVTSLRTTSHVMAERMFEAAIADRRKARILQIEKHRKMKLSEFKKEYEAHRGLQDITDGTRDNDELALRRFMEVVGDLPLRLVDRKTIDLFKFRMLQFGKAKTYVNILLRSLRGSFSYALEEGYIDRNPFIRTRGERWALLFKVDEEVPRFLLMSEIEGLMKAIDDPDFLTAVNVYLYTGLRRKELAGLTIQDVDLENNIIQVRRTKSRKGRAIPINDELRAILCRHIRTDIGHLFPRWRSADTYSRLFHKYATKAGVSARLHDLRHTFASYLAMAGEDLKRIKELLGHADLKTTEIYAKVKTEHLRQSVNKLKFGN